jgi:hypothetical protein
MRFEDLSETGKKIIYGLIAIILTMCCYYFAIYSKADVGIEQIDNVDVEDVQCVFC